MLRLLLLAPCFAVTLTGCFLSPHYQAQKNVNTAMTGACLAARLSPCTIAPSAADKAKDKEAKAAAVRSEAQSNSAAADAEAARRSSCLTDTGPRLPVSSSQCAAYGPTDR